MNPQRILVVDDELSMQRSIQRVLDSRYAVSCASTAREALDIVREQAPDLAILDIRMPDVDGFELLAELRAVQPDIDGIFMTGAVGELDTQIVRAIRERAFYFVTKPFDRDVLLTLVERCLELRRLGAENHRHTARLERELEAARRFQQGLLPAQKAHIGSIAISASYAPCDELGGDLFDYVDAGGGRVAGLVADVSGHGVSAAMLTAIVKSAFHDATDDGFRPASVVRRIARGLSTFEDDRFVTLFCFELDPAARRLDYVNAGHPAAVLWSGSDPPRELPLTGPMVSPAFPDLEWESGAVELGSSGRLFVYTDGIVEARIGDELFGDDRLRTALEDSPREGADALVERVLADVSVFTRDTAPDDDRTLLCADWS